MRLAVNFQRVDPSRGGAETYVADLCGQLVRLGHQVDLYAESWREGVLPGEVRCIAVEAPGRTPGGDRGVYPLLSLGWPVWIAPVHADG